jgi:Flp pilus assembly protein TadG
MRRTGESRGWALQAEAGERVMRREARELGRDGDGDGERGAAVVEFVLVFVALVVPLVYAIAVMADVQRAVLAVSTAAREVGRVYVTAPTRVEAKERTERAYREVMANFGYAAGDPRADVAIRTACSSDSPGCAAGFGPGAELWVRVTYRVPVARLPFLGAIAGPDLPVGATQHTRVDRYRGIGP